MGQAISLPHTHHGSSLETYDHLSLFLSFTRQTHVSLSLSLSLSLHTTGMMVSLLLSLVKQSNSVALKSKHRPGGGRMFVSIGLHIRQKQRQREIILVRA